MTFSSARRDELTSVCRPARHHAIEMTAQIRVDAGRDVERDHEAPVQPEQVDVGDRIAIYCPIVRPEPLLGERENLMPTLVADAPRRVDRRGGERHPRDDPGLCL